MEHPPQHPPLSPPEHGGEHPGERTPERVESGHVSQNHRVMPKIGLKSSVLISTLRYGWVAERRAREAMLSIQFDLRRLRVTQALKRYADCAQVRGEVGQERLTPSLKSLKYVSYTANHIMTRRASQCTRFGTCKCRSQEPGNNRFAGQDERVVRRSHVRVLFVRAVADRSHDTMVQRQCRGPGEDRFGAAPRLGVGQENVRLS